jgi:hypothetical protein
VSPTLAHGGHTTETNGETGIHHPRHEGVETNAPLAVIGCRNHQYSSLASLRQIRRFCRAEIVIPRTQRRW